MISIKQKNLLKSFRANKNPIGTMVSLKIQGSFSTSTVIFVDITLSRKTNGETGFAYNASSFFKFLETLCKWLFLTYLNLRKDTFSSSWHSHEVLSTKIKAVTFFFQRRYFGKCDFQKSESWGDSTKLGSQELNFKGSVAPSTLAHHLWWKETQNDNCWAEGDAPLSWFS